jgi:hypothetical protein
MTGPPPQPSYRHLSGQGHAPGANLSLGLQQATP